MAFPYEWECHAGCFIVAGYTDRRTSRTLLFNIKNRSLKTFVASQVLFHCVTLCEAAPLRPCPCGSARSAIALSHRGISL